MPYPVHISKDLIQWMPLVSFDGETCIVERQDQLPEAMAYLNSRKVVGVDTETRPAFRKGEQYPVALLQIATEDRCYLFRLTALGMPEDLARFFSDPRITKVGLAFKDDLVALRRRRPFEPKNCVDIQKLVPEYGILDMGLQKIFASLFGKKISKSQQLTNWDNISLTPEQARYASTDAWATLLIYKKLRSLTPLSRQQVEQLKQAEHEQQLQHMYEVSNRNDRNNSQKA